MKIMEANKKVESSVYSKNDNCSKYPPKSTNSKIPKGLIINEVDDEEINVQSKKSQTIYGEIVSQLSNQPSETKLYYNNLTQENTNVNNNNENKCVPLIIILSLISVISIIIIIILLVLGFRKKDCKNGYFHPNDDQSNCYNCKIQNCKTCSGSINNQICNSCMENYDEKLENGIIFSCLISNL